MPEGVLEDANRPAKTTPKFTTWDRTDANLQTTTTGIMSGDVWAEERRRNNIASRSAILKMAAVMYQILN